MFLQEFSQEIPLWIFIGVSSWSTFWAWGFNERAFIKFPRSCSWRFNQQFLLEIPPAHVSGNSSRSSFWELLQEFPLKICREFLQEFSLGTVRDRCSRIFFWRFHRKLPLKIFPGITSGCTSKSYPGYSFKVPSRIFFVEILSGIYLTLW